MEILALFAEVITSECDTRFLMPDTHGHCEERSKPALSVAEGKQSHLFQQPHCP